MTTSVTVAYGDGNAPETMESILHILREAQADLTIESIEVGQRVYNMGGSLGVLPYAWDSLKRTRLLLKAPTAAPPEGFTDVSLAILSAMDMHEGQRKPHYGFFTNAKLLFSEFPQENAAPLATTITHISDYFAMIEPGAQGSPFFSLLLASIQLLEHIGQAPQAQRIRTAWLRILKSGVYPSDMPSLEFPYETLSIPAFCELLTPRLS